MHSPIKPTARTITAAEVMSWFGRGHKPWPSEKACAEVADRLTRMGWANEWPPSELGEDEALHWTPDADAVLTETLTVDRGVITIGVPGVAEIAGNGSASVTLTGTAEAIAAALRSATYAGEKKDFLTLKHATTGATGKWTIGPSPFKRWDLWDIKEGATAARMLLKQAPAMLAHFERLRDTPSKTISGQIPLLEGFAAIERLRIALEDALPFVEHPFGKGDSQDHRKRKHPKPWHALAVAVTPVFVAALRQSGHHVGGVKDNSAAVRLVHEALLRMGYGKIPKATIASHLKTWLVEDPGRKF
jgi:hypothetical protein